MIDTYKKIKINLSQGILDNVMSKSKYPLTLIIRVLLEEFLSNTNLRKKIFKKIENENI